MGTARQCPFGSFQQRRLFALPQCDGCVQLVDPCVGDTRAVRSCCGALFRHAESVGLFAHTGVRRWEQRQRSGSDDVSVDAGMRRATYHVRITICNGSRGTCKHDAMVSAYDCRATRSIVGRGTRDWMQQRACVPLPSHVRHSATPIRVHDDRSTCQRCRCRDEACAGWHRVLQFISHACTFRILPRAISRLLAYSVH